MDTVAVVSQHLAQPGAAPTSAPMLDTDKTLAVTAAYLLSEEGRKASLLAGGDGRAVQQLTLHVPANRLHLVSVDLDGVARLKFAPKPSGPRHGRRQDASCLRYGLSKKGQFV